MKKLMHCGYGVKALGTRWSKRVDSIKSFAERLPGIFTALKELQNFKGLTTKVKYEIKGVIKYVSSFTCLLMATVWYKILMAIDNISKVIEARAATLDVEVSNLNSLKIDLISLRERWPEKYREVVNVSPNLSVDHHSSSGISRTSKEISEDTYKINVFYKAIDNVLASMSTR